MTREDLIRLAATAIDDLESEHDVELGYPPDQIAERRGNIEQWFPMAEAVVAALERAQVLLIDGVDVARGADCGPAHRDGCPHSLVDAEGTCQMCGREGIERIQSAAQSDGGDGHG